MPTLAPYEVVEYKREDHITLKKNPNFMDAGSVAIDEVKIRFIGDEGALFPLLRSGALDLLTKVPVLQVKEILEVAQVAQVPVEAVTYLGLNTKKPPFKDLKNRESFRNVISGAKRAELAKILKTDETEADFLLPPSMELAEFKHQKEEPIEEGQLRFEFSMQSDSGSRNQTILEFVQSKLKDELRWKASLDIVDWKTHYSKLKSDPDAVYRFGWQNPVSDPFLIYQIFVSDSPNNFTGWSNKKYDQLVEELRQETRLVKKSKIMAELEAILWKEVPAIPLLHQTLKFAYSKRVSGFRANPFGVILFRELRLSDQTSKKN